MEWEWPAACGGVFPRPFVIRHSSFAICRMTFTVPARLEAGIDELITRYPQKRSASLMVLHALQEHFGWLSKEAIEWTARKLELQPINIYELVTFYPMFRQEPVGKHVIKVCRTLSCALGGSKQLHEHFCAKLGLDARKHGLKPRKTAGSPSSSSSASPVAAPRR